MKNSNGYVGIKHNRLTAVKHVSGDKIINTRYVFRCDCGKEIERYYKEVKYGAIKSCGCLLREHLHKCHQQRYYGVYAIKTPLYRVWASFRNRCNNPKSRPYHNYGARGISICAEWDDYKTFVDWAMANGYKKGLEIDRINNNGNYEPSNCRFVTPMVNTRNRRINRYFCVNGETLCMSAWAERIGVRADAIKKWLVRYGQDGAEAKILAKLTAVTGSVQTARH